MRRALLFVLAMFDRWLGGDWFRPRREDLDNTGEAGATPEGGTPE